MQIMRALDNRNYRFYFIGQSLSLLGNWIQFVAISWLVYRLTSSAFMLGAISFITQIPSLFISPFSGLLADRLNKRRIVITTQALSMLQSGILAVLVLEGQITMEYLFGLGLFSGCVGAVETPSRYAFLVEMVDDPKKIQNVVALNSLLLNVARIIGPVIGGFVIAAIGEGMCFIPIIGLLFAIHVQKTDIIANQKKYLIADIKEGFMYAYRFLPIKYMLSLLTIISLCSVSYLILMPVFAVTTFNSGADTLGYLTSAIGIGAISGSKS